LRAGGEENGGQEFRDGEIVLAVGVAAHAALEAGAVAGEERQVVAGLRDALGGLDGGANGGGVEGGDGAEACVEEKLRDLGVGGLVVSVLRRVRSGGEGGIDVADEGALAEVGVGGFAKFGCAGRGLGEWRR
jgi:hypothetical protein